MKTSIWLIILSLSGLVGQLPGQTTLYRCTSPKFRIDVDNSFEQYTPKGPNIKLAFRDKNRSGATINVMVHTGSEFKGYDIYAVTSDDMVAQIKEFTEVEVISFKKTYISMLKAVTAEYKWLYQNMDTKAYLISWMTEVVYDDKMYYINCTAGSSDFESFRSVFKSAISSFVIEETF